MTALSSDYMSRLLIGAIAVTFTWAQAHGPFRDRLPRYVFPAVQLLCVLWLIHLPRLAGVVETKEDPKPPVVMHMQSEWVEDAPAVVPAPEKARGF